jgi:hypothetical protein
MGLGGVPYQPPTMKVQYTGKTASCDRLKGGESLRLIVQYHANSERTLESLFLGSTLSPSPAMQENHIECVFNWIFKTKVFS